MTAKFLTLEPEALAEYKWTPTGADGVYMDADGFNCVFVVGSSDAMGGVHYATIFFAGRALIELCSTDWSSYVDLARPDGDRGWEQDYAELLSQIGEFGPVNGESAATFVAEHGLDAIYETEGVGEGHEFTAFQGVIARAMSAAFPGAIPEPTGF
jgi:hypothetical protein